MLDEQDKEDIYNYIKSIITELDEKVDRPNVVIEEVLSWTSFQKYLTKNVFELMIESSTSFIPSGKESEIIASLIQSRLIQDWEFQEASVHLRQIQNEILKSTQSKTLLELYQRILQEDYVPLNDSQEQQELLASGLVSIESGKLRVANRIYKQVFNQNWIDKNLYKTQEGFIDANNVAKAASENNTPEVSEDNERRPSEVARVFAYLFIVILAVSFISLLVFLILKSSQSSPSSKFARSVSECQKFSYELDEALKQPPNRLKVITKGLSWRKEQGISLNEQCEDFRKNVEKSGIVPSDIENKFNQVLRQEAQTKIDTNQLEEAVDILCKISDEYEYIEDIKSIFQRWESTRGNKIQNKINQLKSSCPAAQY
ncbi:MAG: hypothetical protein HXY43_09245 [Fischerella sp.]|jgi:hypothetical protein|uniref:hypothetical protein n=1 Tax=Fischerella sp. TaxID=1191 RepID=UPI0018443664|nr:hypothetical protein [Fischerella sp.]NWF59472.1 hypothetical protein [Fischerella sp.]